jgi:SAM-dependent methyltransferase
VFGVFFAADTSAFVAEMWRLLRPGGIVAITTWGPGLFEPGNSLFWEAIRDVDPSLFKAFNPWDDITTPEALERLFERAGVRGGTFEAVAGSHVLDRPDDFWDIVLGTGYRATVDALAPETQDAVRARLLRGLRSETVRTLRTDVVYGAASKRH